MDFALSDILKALSSLLVIGLGFVLKTVLAYFAVKRDQEIHTLGVNKYNQKLKVVEDGVKYAAEILKETPNDFESKKKKCLEYVQKIIPGLTEDQITAFRKIIVNEIKSYGPSYSKLIEPADFNADEEIADVTQLNTVKDTIPSGQVQSVVNGTQMNTAIGQK